MRLRCTTLKAADSILQRKIVEAGTPTWHFNYLNAEDDPYPDVLVLGEFDNPETGNKLVGGINLHYLTPDQLKELQQTLPNIMVGPNLKARYQLGKTILPEIFEDCYRTYDTQHIRAITPEALPTWRPEPMPPRKPLPRPSPPPIMPAPPTARPISPAPPVRPQVPPPMAKPMAPAQPATAPQAPLAPTTPTGPTVDQADLATLANAYKERMAAMAAAKQQEQEQEAEIVARQKLERERTTNLKDLMSPRQEDPLQLGKMESIQYWSPTHGRYITEYLYL